MEQILHEKSGADQEQIKDRNAQAQNLLNLGMMKAQYIVRNLMISPASNEYVRQWQLQGSYGREMQSGMHNSGNFFQNQHAGDSECSLLADFNARNHRTGTKLRRKPIIISRGICWI